jgi:5-methylcytosine-specific restriction endonuclease McrA
MPNRWNIPQWLEAEVMSRDKVCVYCKTSFDRADAPRKTRGTWEHIINDAKIITRENIARCCSSCNASKGAKLLRDWLNSDYCQRRGINASTVSDVVNAALNN